MEARATAKYIRISPQKVRLVVDLIRGKKIDEAQRSLPIPAAGLKEEVYFFLMTYFFK